MSLRVMTYNIRDGGENREAQILEVIQAAWVDVVILEEVFNEDILKFVSQSLNLSYYLGAGKRKRKVALLSRLPVLSFRSYHPAFPIWRNFIDAEIECRPNIKIRVVGVHPMANLGVVFEVWRLWEAASVTKHMQSFQNQPCLLAGDLNAIAPGDRIRLENLPARLKWIIYLQGKRAYHFSIKRFISAGFTDCFRFLNSDDGFTLPTPSPNARLDYIFANTEMKAHLETCRVVREPDSVDRASDHYPVVAEFRF